MRLSAGTPLAPLEGEAQTVERLLNFEGQISIIIMGWASCSKFQF